MAAVVAEQRPQQPRSEQNTPAAFVLALAMHALLVGALWVSVQWRTETSGPVVVELWGGAPPAEPVVVAPPPAPPAPVKAEPEPERPHADIAMKEEKKKPPPKAEPPPDLKKIEAEKRRDAEKKQTELERKRQAEAAAEAAERKREDQRREAVRKSEEARMLAQAGTGSAGGRPSDGAPSPGGRGDAGYSALLAGIIKPRIVFSVPDGTSPSVYADFEVDLLPTGEILAVRLVKPSGLPGYDAAVERAIRRTDPFPRKADGTVERTLKLTFRPVEK